MAANRIKGITVEIGGDTTGLDKALKGVNSEIRSTQSQLKDVEKLLKLDPTNTELLRQKQVLLKKSVEETKNKLETLKEAQKQMDGKEVDKNSEQYMALQREIEATEQSLNELEAAAGKSNTAMSKVAAVAGQISEGAAKVADATKKISAAAGAGIVAIGGMAYKSAMAADELNTLSKQSGISTEWLQKFDYAADLVDVSVDDITGAVRKMKKNLTSNSKDVQAAFAGIGVSIYDASGQMRNAEDIFFDCLQGLSRIGNETLRDNVAMQLFGKSADSLAGIIDDGGAALRAYGDECERLGYVLDQQTLDSLNEVNDKIDEMKMRFKGTLAVSGAKALEALTPVIERVAAVLARVLDFIGRLNTEQLVTILRILAIVAAISPVAGMISKIAGAISTIIPLISTIGTFLAANPIVAVIAAIVVALGILIVYIVKNWDYLKIGMQQAANWIKNLFTKIVNDIVRTVKTLVNTVMQAIENFVNGVINRINNLINVINKVVGAVAGFLGLGYGGIKTIGNVKLPRMATGGVLSSGSALVGEAGPELLTMVGGKAVVQPLTATLDAGSVAALSGSRGAAATNVNIQFTGSLAQLARVLQPQISIEANRHGASLINA